MKKRLIGFLIMTLILSSSVVMLNTISVQAETTDSTSTSTYTDDTGTATTDKRIKVKLDNIREIMVEHSLNLKKYQNNLKIAKENYEYYLDEYGSISDLEDNLSTTKDKIDNFTLETDEETGETNESELNAYESEYKTYQSQLNSMIGYKYDYKKAKKDYVNNVETAVYTAQSDYLNYLVTLSNKELQEDKAKADKRDANIAKISYDSGFKAKKDYISSTITSTASDNTLIDYTNAEVLAKTKLCNELGVDEKKVIFEVDITEDFQKIASINYNNDLKTMLSNNIDIQEVKDTISEAEDKNDITEDYQLEDDEDSDASDHSDTIYDYNMENNKINLKQAKENAEADFKGQYNTLINDYNTIKNSYDKLIEEQAEYKVKQVKNDYGFLSNNDLDDAKLTLDTDTATFIKNRNACYLAYLKYIQMKEGY